MWCPSILVLGVGNTLLRDDGAGVHVIEALRLEMAPSEQRNIVFLDGGTLGLALLPHIESAHAVVVIDAANIGSPPGTIRVFEAAAMDAQLTGRKRTAHELAVADLMDAAALAGHLPDQRALVAIQPATTEWGLAPSDVVAAAMPLACSTVRALIERWRCENGTLPAGKIATTGEQHGQSKNAR